MQKNWEFCQRKLSQLKELGDVKRQNECNNLETIANGDGQDILYMDENIKNDERRKMIYHEKVT